MHKPRIRGFIRAQLWRMGRLVQEIRGENGITTVGQNYILDCMFGAAAPVSQLDPWYISLINNTPTPSLSAADTLISHAGWAELVAGTDYTGNRLAWADADAASGAKTSSSVTTFPMLTTKTVYGIMVCSEDVPGDDDANDVLWATGAFASTISVVNGDDLKISYTLQFA